MTQRFMTAVCVTVLLIGASAVQADVARAASGSFVVANVAPPEADEPQPAPAPATDAAPADTAPANAPAETTPVQAPPADTAPVDVAPVATDAAAAEATTSDAASGDQPASGTPWTWIAIGVVILGALGFGLWWRSARG